MPVVLQDLLNLLSPPVPELGPGPRPGVLGVDKLDVQLRKALAGVPFSTQQPIRATVYLWHDHFENAHSIAQGIETADGSYLHGILHRREPDYPNARYWFHRVGNHPCFIPLAEKAAALLSTPTASQLQKRLVPGGKWDPVAFIEACEAASKADPEVDLLREIQAAELRVLLERFVPGRSPFQ